MKLIKTLRGPVLEDPGHHYLVPENDWDALINREDLESVLTEVMGRASGLREFDVQREARPSMFETDAKTFIRNRELSEDQNFPQAAMPRELQDANPRKIWRLVDGEVTKDAL